jgi:hypothetical protein
VGPHSRRLKEECVSKGFVSLAALGLPLCAAVLLGTTAPASSDSRYDGLWSVVIVTAQGSCDRAYRYPVRIANGSLSNEGPSPATINGKVAGNGAVTVTVVAGNQSATGAGRLSGAVGTGSWKGSGCAGTWEAERRGR